MLGTGSTNGTRVSAAVGSEPGIHLRGLQRKLGVSFSTVRYHVRLLSQSGEVECQRQGHFVRVYPRGFSALEKEMAAAVRGGSTLVVMDEILRSRPTSNKEISSATGLAKSTVSRSVGILVGQGLVKREATAGGRTLVTPNLGMVDRMLALGRLGAAEAVQHYLDLWEL
jgi:predicted transcriptional regulator